MRVAVVTLTGVLLAASALAEEPNPCTLSGGKGVDDKKAPIVCIDLATGYANPDPVRAISGAEINFWFTDSNDEMDVTFEKFTMVKDKKKKAPPNVYVTADKVKYDQPRRDYKVYDLTKKKDWDPTIIIEPIDGPRPAPPIKPRKRFPKE